MAYACRPWHASAMLTALSSTTDGRPAMTVLPSSTVRGPGPAQFWRELGHQPKSQNKHNLREILTLQCNCFLFVAATHPGLTVSENGVASCTLENYRFPTVCRVRLGQFFIRPIAFVLHLHSVRLSPWSHVVGNAWTKVSRK